MREEGRGSYANANSEIIRETSKDSNITFHLRAREGRRLVEREARRAEEEEEKGGEDREEAAVA